MSGNVIIHFSLGEGRIARAWQSKTLKATKGQGHTMIKRMLNLMRHGQLSCSFVHIGGGGVVAANKHVAVLAPTFKYYSLTKSRWQCF